MSEREGGGGGGGEGGGDEKEEEEEEATHLMNCNTNRYQVVNILLYTFNCALPLNY